MPSTACAASTHIPDTGEGQKVLVNNARQDIPAGLPSPTSDIPAEPIALADAIYQNTRGNNRVYPAGLSWNKGKYGTSALRSAPSWIFGCHGLGDCLSRSRSTCSERHRTDRKLQDLRSPYQWNLGQGARPSPGRHRRSPLRCGLRWRCTYSMEGANVARWQRVRRCTADRIQRSFLVVREECF